MEICFLPKERKQCYSWTSKSKDGEVSHYLQLLYSSDHSDVIASFIPVPLHPFDDDKHYLLPKQILEIMKVPPKSCESFCHQVAIQLYFLPLS